MFNNKRDDDFRYILNNPVDCYFEIISINGSVVSSTPVKASLMDLSNSGCKLLTAINLNAASNDVHIMIRLKLREELLNLFGSIKWQLKSSSLYHYGVQFQMNAAEEKQIQYELRTLTALRKIRINQ